MPIGIASNAASLSVQRYLGHNNDKLARVFERLSSGLRISHASDDPAGLAMSSSLEATSRVYRQGLRNISDGISLLTIAEGALEELAGISTRLQELAEQAANGAYTASQRRALQSEADKLVDEHNRILTATEFNGSKLFDNKTYSLQIAAGAGADASITGAFNDNLLMHAGTGVFAGSGSASGGVSAYGSITADVNRDGYDDVVFGQTDTTLAVKFGTEQDGVFSAPVAIDTVGGSTAIVSFVADFNGDGLLDIMAQYYYAGHRLYFGDGEGNFSQSGSFSPSPSLLASGFWVQDFTGDGVLDVAIEGTLYAQQTIVSNTIGYINIATQAGAQAELDRLEGIRDRIAAEQAAVGAFQARLSVAAENLSASFENIEVAVSRIRDVDVASETAEMVRLQILQQAGIAVLAQANQQPSLLLSLLASEEPAD